jgi:peptide deformylase
MKNCRQYTDRFDLLTLGSKDMLEQKIIEYTPTDSPILHSKSSDISIPLTEADKQDAERLMYALLADDALVGLAAPQIGIQKNMNVFRLDPTYALPNASRDSAEFTDGPVLWVNGKYTGIPEEGTSIDYESCVSVPGMAGLVKRYNAIRWEALTIDEQPIEGIYRGFLARVIQHGLDVVKGCLYTEIAEEGSLITHEDLAQLRNDS